MKKTRDELKVLLLQIRNDQITMEEELYEFIQFSDLHEEQFTVLNTFITTDFDVSAIKGHDALFVGGSSDASVLKPEEFTFLADCKLLLRHCYHENIPVFASCFGFQLLVQEFGGEVIVDADNMEMGTYEISLTDEAKEDKLLKDLSNPFWAVSGHRDRALTIPDNAIPLAYTTHCPYHAIKIKNKPIYGFQFHPEIDAKDLETRLTRYQQKYLEDGEQLQQIIESIHDDTSDANQLVKQFIDRVVMDNN